MKKIRNVNRKSKKILISSNDLNIQLQEEFKLSLDTVITKISALNLIYSSNKVLIHYGINEPRRKRKYGCTLW